MKIEIFSDVVCPWCYLGQARFRAALAAFPGEAEVAWRPFQLDPGAPRQAGLADAWLAGKFGGADKVAAAHDHLRGLTGEAGLPYAPEKAMRINSFDAHRVGWLAGTIGVQDEVMARLFRAHHAEGLDLSDAAVLASVAAPAGLDPERTAAVLASEEGAVEVKASLDRARELGISSVPFFLFEGQWAVSGAQSTEVFGAALAEVASKTS